MNTLSTSITTASTIPTDVNKILFNVPELLGLLLQIIELRDYPISLTEISDGVFQINIGDSFYQIHQFPDDYKPNNFHVNFR
jgi:hypothetical protein